jgi:Pyridoxal-phosphate dependent enzyme
MAPRPGKEAVNAMISSIARDLGPSAYAVPRAGATAGGVAGYCGLARELLEQMPSAAFDVVVAVGSGGACAGLLLGFEEAAGPAEDGDGVRVVGVPAGKTPLEAAQAVRRLARLVRDRQLSQADPGSPLRGLRIRGQAGVRSPSADRIAASCGVLLDPVFAGPAWHTACAGPPGPGRPVVRASARRLRILLARHRAWRRGAQARADAAIGQLVGQARAASAVRPGPHITPIPEALP